jgi:hypothetical protein
MRHAAVAATLLLVPIAPAEAQIQLAPPLSQPGPQQPLPPPSPYYQPQPYRPPYYQPPAYPQQPYQPPGYPPPQPYQPPAYRPAPQGPIQLAPPPPVQLPPVAPAPQPAPAPPQPLAPATPTPLPTNPSQAAPGTQEQPTPQPEQPAPPAPEPNAWEPRNTAELDALNKIDARVTHLEVPVGKSATFGTLTIAVKSCEVRPPDRAPDAAAWLDITDSNPNSPSFHGWMLAQEPAVSVLEHPVYDVKLADCK